jgi:molybdopterin-guanine dinucleotide biosynthesis protein A
LRSQSLIVRSYDSIFQAKTQYPLKRLPVRLTCDNYPTASNRQALLLAEKHRGQPIFMKDTSNITGLVLAGGAGRRVGRRDKGLIVWRGKPLVAHVCKLMKPQVGHLLISCNRNISRYKEFSEQTISDDRADFQGPLAGLEAASRYIQSEFMVVASCDMPLLPQDFVSRLVLPLDRGIRGSPDICYAHDGARAQYLCAAFRRDCLFTLSRFMDDGHRAVHTWYQQHHAIPVDFSDQNSSFRNFNKLD